MKSALMLGNALGFLMAAVFPIAAMASDHDFHAAVDSIEATYHVRRQHLPMIGLASLCTQVATGGAVKGLEIAQFKEGSKLPEGADMPALLTRTLGPAWSLVVQSRSSGEQDAVYARPRKERMVLLVASYDHGELSVVRLDMDGVHLAAWMKDHFSQMHHSDTTN